MRKNRLLQYTSLAITMGLVVFSIIETKTKTGIDPESGLRLRYEVISGIKYAAIGLSVVLGMVMLKIRFWKHVFTLLLLVATLG